MCGVRVRTTFTITTANSTATTRGVRFNTRTRINSTIVSRARNTPYFNPIINQSIDENENENENENERERERECNQ
jgi:hypothetical protein